MEEPAPQRDPEKERLLKTLNTICIVLTLIALGLLALLTQLRR